MKKYLLIPLIALTAACSVNSNQGVMKADTRKSGFMGLATTDAVTVDTDKAFKGTQDVVVASFYVGFAESKRLKSEAKGIFGGGGFGGKSTGLVKLVGIDDATKQAITDAAYQDFVAKLKAQGFNVVDRSALTGHEKYAGTKKFTTPYTSDTSGLFSSYGTAKYYSPTVLGNSLPAFPYQLPNEMGGFGTGTIAATAEKLSKEKGINTVYAAYLIDFAGSEDKGGFTTSAVTVGQLLSVDQGLLGIQTKMPEGVSMGNSSAGKIALGQPIASDQTYGEVVQTTSQAGVAGEAALNVASSILGAGSNQTREFEFKADAGKFKTLSVDVLSKANASLVGKMGSLK